MGVFFACFCTSLSPGVNRQDSITHLVVGVHPNGRSLVKKTHCSTALFEIRSLTGYLHMFIKPGYRLSSVCEKPSCQKASLTHDLHRKMQFVQVWKKTTTLLWLKALSPPLRHFTLKSSLNTSAVLLLCLAQPFQQVSSNDMDGLTLELFEVQMHNPSASVLKA